MKTSTKKLLIGIGIAVGVLLVTAMISGVILVAKYFSTMNEKGSTYSATVQMAESAPKSFTSSEVAEIGPYDITVSAEKEYKPSQADLDAVQKQLNRTNNTYNLAGDSGQFVLVTLNVKYNEARSAYDSLSVSTSDWTGALSELLLNDMSALAVTPNIDTYKVSKPFAESTKSNEGAALTLLYRVPKGPEAYTLTYDITIFSKVSAIVGTEGMPRKTLEYTIGIQ